MSLYTMCFMAVAFGYGFGYQIKMINLARFAAG